MYWRIQYSPIYFQAKEFGICFLLTYLQKYDEFSIFQSINPGLKYVLQKYPFDNSGKCLSNSLSLFQLRKLKFAW